MEFGATPTTSIRLFFGADDARHVRTVTVNVLAGRARCGGMIGIRTRNLSLELQIRVKEIETCIDHRNANTVAGKGECAWSGANPLHTRGYNLGARRGSRSGDLGGIRIGRLSARVESPNAIRIRRLTLEAEVAQGRNIKRNLRNLDKAGATRHRARATLNSESVFIAGVVRPAQLHMAVGHRRRRQITRVLAGGGAAGVVAFAMLEYAELPPTLNARTLYR